MTHSEMIDAVVRRVFGKENGSKACIQELCNSACRQREKCCISEKSEHQLDYIISPVNEDTFLDACPGSGKTEVIGLKAAYEFQAWEHQTSGVAILTFTNNSAEVITKRVTQYAGIERTGYPHFVGTLDSWLHGYLAQPFGHLISRYQGKGFDHSIRLVEEGSTGDWLNSYRCAVPYVTARLGKLRQIPRSANMLRYDLDKRDWDIRTTRANVYVSTEEYFNSLDFQSYLKDNVELTLDIIRQNFTNTKKKFLRAGFATYDDMECLCYWLLKQQPKLAKALGSRFPLIIVDECQDLSFSQLKILGHLNQAGSKLHFVGDLNQAIYDFRKVDPQRVRSFVGAYKFKNRALPDNFRSCQPVVDLCGKLVSTDAIKGCGSTIDGAACVCFKYNRAEDLSNIPVHFERYLEQRRIRIERSAILARGRSTVYRLQSLENQKLATNPSAKLALAIYLWSTRDSRLWDDSLRSLGDFLSLKCLKTNRGRLQDYYCPTTVSSPVSWRLFLARVLEECSRDNDGIGDLNQMWTQWAKCAHERFFEIANSCRAIVGSELPLFASDGIKSPTGFTNIKVQSSLSKPRRRISRIKISTIHGVKGDTFDAILLVSPPTKGQGGHWKEWLANPNDEHARFAYVASSRPRHLLAWAIRGPKAEDEDVLRGLGFQMEQFVADSSSTEP